MRITPSPADALVALPAELAAAGVTAHAIVSLATSPENWRFRLIVGARQFEVRYDAREGLRCHEITPGGERALTSADMPPNLRDSARLRAEALRRIRYALDHPGYEVAQPPVI